MRRKKKIGLWNKKDEAENRKWKKTKMTVKRKTITLEVELLDKVNRIRKKEGRSFSNMVQRIITEWLDELYAPET